MKKLRVEQSENSEASAALTSCPSWLSSKAKVEWHRIIDSAANDIVFEVIDSTCLAQYCELTAELQQNSSEFPAAKHTQLRLLMQELGLTPASRLKNNLEYKKDSEPNPWKDFK